jgi:predicted MPP superfamily phosphohydrolase
MTPPVILRRAALFAAVIGATILGCVSLGGSAAPQTPRSTVTVAATPPSAPPTALPRRADSLKFLVFGDFGTGEMPQYELAAQMAALYQTFKFEMVALVGDNIYGSERPQDFKSKFELPYKPLLDAGVKFYASLGNHDAHEQRYYKLFNMDGKLYYSFKAPKQDVRFIALESTYPVPEQLQWLEETLKSAKEVWKIVYFHHPLYSSGVTHGSDLKLRATLEPLFVKYGVSLVLTGHDHIYERMKPQAGIQYFVTGSGGALRPGDVRRGQPFSARIVDDVQVFLAAEIYQNELVFNAISRTGEIVDSGVVARREGS